ncbi:MAG: hypothetical protein ACFFAN_06720 [Promethearchaeota archaeon]
MKKVILNAIEIEDFEMLDFLLNEEDFLSFFNNDELYQFLLKTKFNEIYKNDIEIKNLFDEIFDDNLKNYKRKNFLHRILQIVS